MSEMKEAFVRVGKVKDAHGIKGELFVTLFAGEAAWLPQLKELKLVKEDDSLAPRTFQIKSVRMHKNGLIAKTIDIADRNEAETLKGWLMEIPSELLVSEKGEEIFLREIRGFKVVTKHKGEVGTVEAFGTNTVQDLLVVRTAHGDFEIPFVEAFVERLDFENKVIYLDIPEGLLGEFDVISHDASNGESENNTEDDADNDSDDDLDGDDLQDDSLVASEDDHISGVQEIH